MAAVESDGGVHRTGQGLEPDPVGALLVRQVDGLGHQPVSPAGAPGCGPHIEALELGRSVALVAQSDDPAEGEAVVGDEECPVGSLVDLGEIGQLSSERGLRGGQVGTDGGVDPRGVVVQQRGGLVPVAVGSGGSHSGWRRCPAPIRWGRVVGFGP